MGFSLFSIFSILILCFILNETQVFSYLDLGDRPEINVPIYNFEIANDSTRDSHHLENKSNNNLSVDGFQNSTTKYSNEDIKIETTTIQEIIELIPVHNSTDKTLPLNYTIESEKYDSHTTDSIITTTSKFHLTNILDGSFTNNDNLKTTISISQIILNTTTNIPSYEDEKNMTEKEITTTPSLTFSSYLEETSTLTTKPAIITNISSESLEGKTSIPNFKTNEMSYTQKYPLDNNVESQQKPRENLQLNDIININILIQD